MKKLPDIFSMALKDLQALEGMVNDTNHFSDEIFGFHAQQAIEKALKAWITMAGGDYQFTHDISLLMRTLENLGVDMNGWTDLLELASFGVQFRYEEMGLDDEPLNRIAIVKRVTELTDVVTHLQ